MIIVPSGEAVPRTGTGLLESPEDRERQRLAMLALLRRWDTMHGLKFDAIHVDDSIDYLIVAEGSYTGGPLPVRVAGQVEYKRRHGDFRFPHLFVEEHKRTALTERRARLGGVPIFVAEWDDVVQLWDARDADGLEMGWMRRLDRKLPQDTDWGYYVTPDRMFTIRKPRLTPDT